MGSVVFSPAPRDTVHHPFTMSQVEEAPRPTITPSYSSASLSHQTATSSNPSPAAHDRLMAASVRPSSSMSALSQQVQARSQTPTQINVQPPSETSMHGSTPTPTGPQPAQIQEEQQRAQRTGYYSSPASPRLRPTHLSTTSLGGSAASSPSRIRIRNLSHIQSFASEELLTSPRGGRGFQDIGRQYEISAMPVTDIIEMVAGLLTKITTTNDMQHEHMHRNIQPPEGGGGMNAAGSSVLAFHGKNVPSISILSYLSRIHKYCPTTYEVFLSLLVYFDRMTESVNKGFLQNMQRKSDAASGEAVSSSAPPATSVPVPRDSMSSRSSASETPPSSSHQTPSEASAHGSVAAPPSPPQDDDQCFVVDSFNIHRLVIAGVTCASKFFSDVFYTNSRYAKVRPQFEAI